MSDKNLEGKVIVPFPGVKDGEIYPTKFIVGDTVTGDLARVAIEEKWAKPVGGSAAAPVTPPAPAPAEPKAAAEAASGAKAAEPAGEKAADDKKSTKK